MLLRAWRKIQPEGNKRAKIEAERWDLALIGVDCRGNVLKKKRLRAAGSFELRPVSCERATRRDRFFRGRLGHPSRFLKGGFGDEGGRIFVI
jgi:hypothetical protein